MQRRHRVATRVGLALVALLLTALPSERAAALIRVAGIDIGARDVEIVGRLAYVADYDYGLRVVDISIPERPLVIGGFPFPGALSVAVEGDLALIGGVLPTPMRLVDIGNPRNPTELAVFDDAECRGSAVIADRIAYITGIGLCIVDLTRPRHLRRLASLRLPGYITDVEVRGSVAYATTSFPPFVHGGTLQLVDVSTTATPRVLSSVTLLSNAYDVALAGNVAWVNQEDRLTSIDVSDPRAATLIATTSLPLGSVPYWRRMEVRGSLGYLTSGWNGLQALEVSDPSQPRFLGSLDTPGAAKQIALVGDLALVADGKGLEFVDVSYPYAPFERSHLDTPAPALGLAVADGRAYVAGSAHNGPGFLEIVDVSDPDEIGPLGAIELPQPVFDVELSNQTALLAGYEFRTVDVSDPTSPAPLGQLEGYSTHLAVNGSLALAGSQKIDISDPTSPVSLGFGFGGGYFDLVGELVYAAGYQSGLVVSDLATAKVIATAPGAHPANRVTVDGETAYVGESETAFEGRGRGWLRALDVSDPEAPLDIDTVETHGAIYDIEVEADRVYLATRGDSAGVAVLDVSNPTQLCALGGFATPGLPEDLELADGLVHLADGRGGLRIIDFGPEYRGARRDPPRIFDVDVAPGRRDRIGAGRRRVRVAVLSSGGRFAPEIFAPRCRAPLWEIPGPDEIDPTSLRFGPSKVPVTGHPRLPDLNRDGLPDLVVEFDLRDAGLGTGNVEACVDGALRDGRRVFGCDDVFVRAR